MDDIKFREWLISEKGYNNPKLVRDCVCRAARVERVFQHRDPKFSFEKEFKRDKGESLKNLISRRGIAIDFPIALPVGTNQMDSIASAVKKYFLFLEAETKPTK